MVRHDKVFFMNQPNETREGFATPMRPSLRQWLKIEAARRDIRMQDLVDEIVSDAKGRTEGRA